MIDNIFTLILWTLFWWILGYLLGFLRGKDYMVNNYSERIDKTLEKIRKGIMK